MLDHAGVLVADLERSVRFYCDVLGLREAARFSFGSEHLVFLRACDGWHRVAFLEGPDGERIELIERR